MRLPPPRGTIRGLDWPNSAARPLVQPIQPSVVYTTGGPDALDAVYVEGSGYTYAREGHPNADVLGARIDALEGAPVLFPGGGVVTGSGMGAMGAVFLGLLKAGDHVVAGDQLYGRTLRLLTQDLPRMGITVTLADPTRAEAMAAAMRPETRMVVVETISNPTMRVADLEGIAALCKAGGALMVVDNTFTTPRLYQPFAHGADVVVHSVTKLLAGHSDATLGWAAARDPAHQAAMALAVASWGLTPSPFDCWLADRGLHTFELRHIRAQETAGILAEALAGMPGVTRVIWPSRADHPDHARAMALFGGQGGNMLSFEIAGGRPAANAFVAAAEGLAFAPTLGDVGTTLSHPPSSSHRALTLEGRAALGISEGFFRVSVGLEAPSDLVAIFSAGARAAAAA